jgi:hypothetical protein
LSEAPWRYRRRPDGAKYESTRRTSAVATVVPLHRRALRRIPPGRATQAPGEDLDVWGTVGVERLGGGVPCRVSADVAWDVGGCSRFG